MKRLIKADNIYDKVKQGLKEFEESAKALHYDTFENDGIVAVCTKHYDKSNVNVDGKIRLYENVDFYVCVNYSDVSNPYYEAGVETNGENFYKEFSNLDYMINAMKNPSEVKFTR